MTTALVVDDSPYVQTVLYKVLSEHGYAVLTAEDAVCAVEMHVENEPELVVIDADRPDADGVAVIESMVGHSPARVLALSAREAVSERLAHVSGGAIECLERNSDDLSIDLEEFAHHVAEAIRRLEATEVESAPAAHTGGSAEVATAGGQSSQIGSDGHQAGPTPSGGHTHSVSETSSDVASVASAAVDEVTETVRASPVQPTESRANAPPDQLPTSPVPLDRSVPEGATIVIGASTGGPRIVESVLATLPPALEAKVLVVQHMPATFTDRFARRLDSHTAYDVSEATDGASVSPGEVLVAKGGYHLAAESASTDRLDVSLLETPSRHGVRPAIDVTMETVAATDSKPLVGIALTGMGSDGVDGLGTLTAAGGTTIAQDEATSPVFGIPRRAIEAGVTDHVVPAGEIVPAVIDSIATTGDRDA